MALPDGHYKVGNRVYTVMDVDGTDYVVKYTHDVEADALGSECGRWEKTEFLAHADTYDGNTENEYDAIKTALGI